MRKIFLMLLILTLCFSCFCVTAFAADDTTTESTETTEPTEDDDYASGVLGWLQRLWDGITSLPQKIADALSFSEIRKLFDGFDFSPVTDFFTNFWSGLQDGFGFKSFIEDPEGPFGWLSDASATDDGESATFKSGIFEVFNTFGAIIDALPSEVVSVASFSLCGLLVVAGLLLF